MRINLPLESDVSTSIRLDGDLINPSTDTIDVHNMLDNDLSQLENLMIDPNSRRDEEVLSPISCQPQTPKEL